MSLGSQFFLIVSKYISDLHTEVWKYLKWIEQNSYTSNGSNILKSPYFYIPPSIGLVILLNYVIYKLYRFYSLRASVRQN